MTPPVRPDRHLLLGLLHQGVLQTELRIAPGRSVTIGDDAASTLRTSGPRRLLFASDQQGWELYLTDDLDGRVASRGSSATLARLRASEEVMPRGDALAVPLLDSDRGSLTLDADTTLLFRFTDPPPSAVPLDFRPALLEADDPVFLGFLGLASAAAAAFLVHVALAPVGPADAVLALGELDRLHGFVVMPQPPPDTEPASEPEPSQPALSEPVVKRTPPKPEAPAIAKPSTPDPEADVRARSTLLQRLKDNPDAFAGLLGGTAELDAELIGAVRDIKGEREAARDTTGLRTAREDSTAFERVDDRSPLGGGTSQVAHGPVATGPDRAELFIQDEEIIHGDPIIIADIIRTNFGSLVYCYERELKNRGPGFGGRMELSFEVAGGRVQDVSVVHDALGSPSMADCVTSRARRWNFRGVDEAAFIYPFIFKSN